MLTSLLCNDSSSYASFAVLASQAIARAVPPPPTPSLHCSICAALHWRCSSTRLEACTPKQAVPASLLPLPTSCAGPC